MKFYKYIFEANLTAMTATCIKILQKQKLYSCFPNIFFAKFLTISVTVASGERSSSKLKLIKNDLRSAEDYTNTQLSVGIFVFIAKIF